MNRGLSVLPSFFIIIIVLFWSADFGFGKTPGASSPAGSPTVPASAYDRNLKPSPAHKYYSGQTSSTTAHPFGSVTSSRSHTSRFGSDLSRRPGALNLNSPLRRSSRYTTGLSAPGRLNASPSRSTGSVKRNDLPGLRPSGDLSRGSIGDYKLSPLDKKLSSEQYLRGNFRGNNIGNISAFQGPVSADIDQFSRRLDVLAAEKKMIDDEFLRKSGVHTGQDRALSQEAKLDVNLVQETSREKVFKNDLLAESLVPESGRIEKPLSPDEIRQKLGEMLALEKLQENQTAEPVELLDNIKTKDDADKSRESKQDAGKKALDMGKDSKDAKSDASKDPLAGITPGNIDYKLKQSRRIITKIKDFQAHVDNKFTTYMTTADKCLAEGEYRKAMNNYEIASVWKGSDPRSYAGKAFAHLAVGEYFDSSRCLIRAIESSDDFAAGRTDVAAKIGNKKLYDKHLAELKSTFAVGGDHNKAFLLAYLYTQEGDFVRAKECVDYAATKLGESAAWKSLSKVIEERLAITR